MSKELQLNNEQALYELRSFTGARIVLGRTGVSMPINESLSFKMAHANARDAVHENLSIEKITAILSSLNQPFLQVNSQASNRSEYLLRPDLGRKLDERSVAKIKDAFADSSFDFSIIIADGLSALAVHKNLEGLLKALIPQLSLLPITLAPFLIVEQGRVAISDEIGNLCRAKISIIILGERPGLSSPDSLGIYLTYAPTIGNTDNKRNCISNIRSGGLTYQEATNKLIYLINEAMRLKMSGVALKDNTHSQKLND